MGRLALRLAKAEALPYWSMVVETCACRMSPRMKSLGVVALHYGKYQPWKAFQSQELSYAIEATRLVRRRLNKIAVFRSHWDDSSERSRSCYRYSFRS